MISRAAFTLVEMAIILIVMGIIVGGSSKIFTSLSKNAKIQESRDLLKQISLDIEGFSKVFNRLPKTEELMDFRIQSKDSWGKIITYIPAEELTVNLCGIKKSSLEHKQNEKTVKNLAYILISSGANRNLQTSIDKETKTRVTSARRSELVDFNKAEIDRVEPYDDFYITRTLWAMQAQLQCNDKGSL